MSDSAPVAGVVDGLFRRSAGRLVALLARRLGADRLDLAEEAVQDAMVRALELWPHRGVPTDPEAWLHTVARNRALDLLRRETRSSARLDALAAELEQATLPAPADAAASEVRLLFLATHPVLSVRARVVLALKAVGGLGVREIARALLAEEAAIAQMVVRAKRAIRDAGLTLELPPPAELPRRLPAVLDTLYLTFNEGYAATAGELAVREDLCLAAIRLTELLLAEPATARPEVHALLALQSFHASRLRARVAADGTLRLLDEQDREQWDQARIAAGFAHLERAARGARLTAWHLEAGIASCHARARRPEDTDWPAILAFHDRLLEVKPSPVTRLSRAVAVARVRGWREALGEVEAIERLPAMRAYHLLPAVKAELLREAGDPAGAAAAIRQALARAATGPERRLLERRLARLEEPG